MDKSKVIELYKQFPDEERHSLIVENPDWENKITPALLQIGQIMDAGEMGIVELALNIHMMVEIAYVMGTRMEKE